LAVGRTELRGRGTGVGIRPFALCFVCRPVLLGPS
jgi:hypothetical protein